MMYRMIEPINATRTNDGNDAGLRFGRLLHVEKVALYATYMRIIRDGVFRTKSRWSRSETRSLSTNHRSQGPSRRWQSNNRERQTNRTSVTVIESIAQSIDLFVQ